MANPARWDVLKWSAWRARHPQHQAAGEDPRLIVRELDDGRPAVGRNASYFETHAPHFGDADAAALARQAGIPVALEPPFEILLDELSGNPLTTLTIHLEIRGGLEDSPTIPGLAVLTLDLDLLRRIEFLTRKVAELDVARIEQWTDAMQWTEWMEDGAGETVPGTPFATEYAKAVLDGSEVLFTACIKNTGVQVRTDGLWVKALRQWFDEATNGERPCGPILL